MISIGAFANCYVCCFVICVLNVLDLLIVLVKDYDDKHYELPELDALEVIKYKMGEMGLKAKDLEPIIGSKGHVSAILSGKREITLKMAQKLKNYFSIPAEVFLHRV